MILLAAASAVETYGGEGGKIVSETADASALPMTGLELAMIFGVGLILIGVGIVVAKLN